jgi:plastocyanin
MKEIPMPRIRILLVATVAMLALTVAGTQASAAKVKGTLTGKVGPGSTITLTQKGKAVKTLKAGIYRINVSDSSDVHNFHLFGPGVNKKTGVGSFGGGLWTVKLKKGAYTYRCDAHFMSGMIKHFKVT